MEGTSAIRRPKGAPQALTLEQIAAIRTAAAAWRTGPDVMGPKPDGKVADAIETLLGTGMRPSEVLALRPVDIRDGTAGMVAHVRGTVVYRPGQGSFRQDRPKTDASVRRVPVPEFAAAVIRRRLRAMTTDQAEWTIFHNRDGLPLSQHNVRRTFRAFLELADLPDAGISPRWSRRTAATVVARGLGLDAAATHLGHTSSATTQGHYVEPDVSVDRAAARVLESTLRPVDADGSLLARPETEDEAAVLDALDVDAEE